MTVPTRPLSVDEAADRLGISRRQLDRFVKAGLIPAADMRTTGAHYANWKFEVADVDAFKASRTVGAA